jgi:translation initiation factor IF-2-like protein
VRHIRINDLAREIGLKSNRILAALPNIGIDDDKNHSSSVNEGEANRIRAYFLPRDNESGSSTKQLGGSVPVEISESPKPDAKSTSITVARPSTVLSRLRSTPQLSVRHSIVICPKCQANIREDRLRKHLADKCASRGGKKRANVSVPSRVHGSRTQKKRSKPKKRPRLKRGKNLLAKWTAKAQGSGWVSFVSGGRPGSNRRH